MFKHLKFILVFLWLVSQKLAVAQTTYPVQVSTYLVPPYSLYLSDYYSGTRDKLVVQLANRDMQNPTINVYLRMTITAGGVKLVTNPNSVVQPIAVDTGVPLRLTQEELAPYFQPANLISQGFLAEGKLPEGVVEFCFQAVEAHTGRVVSLPSCTRAWVTSQKPPLLSLPLNNENILFREPLNLMFQWTPRHQGLTYVEYEFILKELWDTGMTPQAAFAYSPEIVRETVRSTSFIYGAMQPPLLPGKRYAWAVRAQARDGIDATNVFQNDGLSEIRWFTLQDNCAPPTIVTATAERRAIKLEWKSVPENIGFTVSYRPLSTGEGRGEADWKELESRESNVIINGLKNGTTYQYRVGNYCMVGQPVYSPLFTITLPSTDSARLAQCGIMPVINLTNKEPIKELKTAEVFKANDYPITITKISHAGGTYTGEGWTIIPFLNDAKIAVKFTSITINTDKQMIEGYVETRYDKNQSQIANLDKLTEGGFDVGKVKTGITKIDYKFDFAIPGVEAFSLNDEGQLVIKDTDGTPHTVDTSDKSGQGNDGNKVQVFPMTVQDKNGNVYQVEKVVEKDASGKEHEVAKATLVAKASDPLTADNFDATQLDGDKAIVKFSKGEGYYAFDEWLSYYDKVALIQPKYEDPLYNGYHVPWKLLVDGKTDKVKANIEVKDNAIDPKKVIFKTPKGTQFQAEYNEANKEYTIQLAAGPAGDVQEVYALHPKSDGKTFYNLGKLSVATYEAQTYDVVLVPVAVPVGNGNETGYVDADAIKQTLENTYGPVGVTWNVTRDDPFEYSGEYHLMANNTGLATYNEAMRALNNAYKEGRPKVYNANANVLFFLLNTGSSNANRDLTGFMPRGAQFGYIFTSEIVTAKIPATVAHELGHGRWKLFHTFDEHYGGFDEAKETDNLMAYANGQHIAKWQWDVMNDPAWIVNIFEGDQKSASFANAPKDEKGVTYLLDKPMNFVAMSGKVVPLPQGALIKFYCQDVLANDGQLIGFKIDGVDYIAKSSEIGNPNSTSDFSGFYKISTTNQYTAEVYKNNTVLQSGEHEITFIHQQSSDNGKSIIKIVTEKKLLTENNIERSNGNFSGPRSGYAFTYDNTVEPVGGNKLEYVSSCSSAGGQVFTPIVKDGRYKITVEKTANGEWKAIVKIDPAVKRNPKIDAQELEKLEAELSRMSSEKLNELGGLNGKSSAAVKMETEDGGEFYAKSMNGIEWLHTIGHLGSTVWEDATLPKEYWNQDENYAESAIHVPPTFAGVSDGVIDELMSYPQLAKLGYDVATKEEVRQGLWNGVKNISPESIKNAAVQFYEEKKADYTSDKSYIVRHTVGKDGVQVASMFFGVGGIKNVTKNLDEGVEKAGKEIVSEIDDVLVKSVEGADGLAKKSLKEAIEKGDFESELVEGLRDEVNDVAKNKSRKLSWEEVKAFFKRGNDFNRKVNSKVPPKYDFNEVTVEQVIDGEVKKFRLDGYNEGLEIVSRKVTDFDNIQRSTFEKYCDELIIKYKEGTKITAPKYPELNGKTLKGKYKLEVPKSNELSSKLNEFKSIAQSKGIEIVFEAE